MSRLDPVEVGRRARAGILLVGVRGLVVRVVGLVGNVVLAHLVAPGELGRVAFALAFAAAARFVADAGMAAALIRAPEEPSREDVAACFAGQLLTTTAVAVCAGALVPLLGSAAALVAIVALALPLTALRLPGLVGAERDLAYRPVVVADGVDVAVSLGTAIALTAGGLGATGIAAGVPAGAVAGSAAIVLLTRSHWTRPRFSWSRWRRVLGFGVAFQSIALLNLLRDQGVNAGIFVISGAGALGLWTLGYRLLQVPFLLFEALWRVSFPAMSRLVAQGADVRDVLQRGISVASAWTGLLVVALVGGAPSLVPAVLGDRWAGVAVLLPAVGLSLVVGGPVSAAGVGYLYAVGDTRRVFLGTLLHTACWLGVGLGLLGALGVAAISVGWLVGGLLETAVFASGLRQHAGVKVVLAIRLPVLCAVIVGACGWGASEQVRGLLPGLAVSLASAAVYATLLTLVDTELVRRSLRSVVGSFPHQ